MSTGSDESGQVKGEEAEDGYGWEVEAFLIIVNVPYLLHLLILPSLESKFRDGARLGHVSP
jgi:hypothetical protein